MNDYFCVLPFFSYEGSQQLIKDKNIYCCRLPTGTNIHDVQTAIKNKQRSPACKICWDLEDQGLDSERKIHNRTFDYYADRDIDLVEQNAVAHGYSPKIIKLATSSLCNGACMTCGPDSSSAWAALENRSSFYNTMDTSAIDFENIIQLSFVGGEPLLEKKNFEILEKLIELGNTKCFISIVTNGSIELTTKQLNILNKFKNLNICLSIDGIARQFEYIRWPLKWSRLELNLKQFKQITQHVNVSCMISNLNIFYYTEMIDFFKDNKLNYLCKKIIVPKYFAPGNLSADFKQQVVENNKKYHMEVKAFLTHGDQWLEKFWAEIDRQDQLKKISIKDYLPELAATRI